MDVRQIVFYARQACAKEVSLKDIETSVSVPSHLTSTETHRIVVDIAAQDYIQASWLHHNLTPLRITGVIVIASLIGTFAHKTGVLSASICVGGVLGYLTWYFLYYFVILKARCEKLYDQQKTLHTPIEVGWTDEQVEFVGANGTTVLKWSDYVKHKENSRLFLLYQSDLLFNVVPKSSFASPEQLRDFSSNLKD